jgi:Tol biopolymer transport system component
LHCFNPKVARDARIIVFSSTRADRIQHIWKMDLDGGSLVQLTNGAGEAIWAVSPDGKAILMFRVNEPGLWKAPLAGGSPIKIADLANFAKYSPDGRHLLVNAVRENAGRSRLRLEVLPSGGGAPIRTIDLPSGASIFSTRPAGRSRAGWTPSGDGLTYIREVDGVGNIWTQPLVGGEPRPITNFKSGQIAEYDFSPDGKQLFFTRDEVSTDVVLITNFK